MYPAGAASPVFARCHCERHGLRWIHPAACLAHPLPDGTAVALYRDLDRTAASLDAVHPGDGERWRAFAAPFLRHFDALRDTMLGGFPPVAGSLRLAGGLGPRGILDFARLLLTPAQALGEELFEGDGSRAWLYGSAMHSDVPPGGRGSAIAAAYMNLLGHGVGWPSPEGGAGRLAEALVSYLEELGGEVRTGATGDEVRRRARPRRGRGTAGGRAARRAAGGRRRDARGARGLAGDALPGAICPRAAPLPLWPGDTEDRLGARRPDSLERAARRAKRAPSTSAARRAEMLRTTAAIRRRSARAPVHAARPAVARRPLARARG